MSVWKSYQCEDRTLVSLLKGFKYSFMNVAIALHLTIHKKNKGSSTV